MVLGIMASLCALIHIFLSTVFQMLTGRVTMMIATLLVLILFFLGPILSIGLPPSSASVSRSSTEAEYRSIANAKADILWTRSILTELGSSLSSPPVIYCDNVGVTYLCSNPVFHSRMKHIAIDFHFVRDLVQSSLLRVSHVSSAD